MGKMSFDEWLYWSLPLIGATRKKLLLDRIDQVIEIGRLENECRQAGKALASHQLRNIALSDQLAATTLELATLRNKIVERAQVPSTLKAKTSADVRRIVEQANEAEFEEQANGIQ